MRVIFKNEAQISVINPYWITELVIESDRFHHLYVYNSNCFTSTPLPTTQPGHIRDQTARICSQCENIHFVSQLVWKTMGVGAL